MGLCIVLHILLLLILFFRSNLYEKEFYKKRSNPLLSIQNTCFMHTTFIYIDVVNIIFSRFTNECIRFTVAVFEMYVI